MSEHTPVNSLLVDELISQVADEFQGRLGQGERPAVEEYVERYPQFASTLRQLLPALEALFGMGAQPPAPAGSPQTPPSPPGYAILGELGRGGMGVVYRARHQALSRVVALKVIRAGVHAGADDRARFRREAEAAARLRHPNVVQVYEVGEHQGAPYLALEFCPGGSLADALGGVPLPAAVAARMTETLALAVEAAHRERIVHRDLKPANVLLAGGAGPRGQGRDAVVTAPPAGPDRAAWFLAAVLKVTDFGLAKDLDEAGGTQSGAILGTPSYVAPEQAAGRSKAVGPAADVYALGAILYELLTGRPPFRAATPMETLLQVLDREPVAPRQLQPGVPRDLETICLKCLEKTPHRRYASAQALAEDLRRFQEGRPVLARPVGLTERLGKWARRRPAVAALLAAVTALLAAVAAVAVAGLMGVLWQHGETLRENQNYLEAARRAEANQKKAEDNADDALQKKKAAEDARAEADQKSKDLERSERKTRKALANNQVLRSQDALAVGEMVRAAGQLDEVDPEFRRWEWHYLKRQTDGGLLTLRGHTNTVKAVTFSPDGRRLSTASWDGTVKVWDARTGQEVSSFRWFTGAQASYFAFSPDGRRLAIGGFLDRTVKVVDAQTGQALYTLKGHPAMVTKMAFSPDGERLATGGLHPVAKVWDARTGRELLTLKMPAETAFVYQMAFGPDGRRLAVSASGQPGRVWDTSTGRVLLTLRDQTGGHVAFSPDGRRLATAGGDVVHPILKVWDARTGEQLLSMGGVVFRNVTPVFSPDGQRLITVGGTVRVLDLRSGQELLTLRGSSAVADVAFSPDGQRLATAGEDWTVKVWDTRPNQGALSFPGGACMALSRDGRRLAVGSNDGAARVWDARTGQQLLTCKGHKSTVTAVAFNPDGTRLASGSNDYTAKVWDAHTGLELRTLKGDVGHVHALAFSPDGRRLAIASAAQTDHRQTVTVWDAGTGEVVFTFRGDKGQAMYLAFSHDGRRLATVVGDVANPVVKVWDAKTGQELLTLRGHAGMVYSPAFSPDDRRLATASLDKTARVWDADTGRELITVQGHAPMYGVAFSPDGERLVTADKDQTARVWDAHTGQELLALRGQGAPVRAVAFSRDGQWLATLGGAVNLWDARPDTACLSLRGHTEVIHGVDCSPDGKRLATVSQDLTARVWDTHSGRELLCLRGHTAPVTGVCYSPDGRRLATADGHVINPVLKVWDATEGRELLSLKGSTVAFSPDGGRLVACLRMVAKVWDADTGREVLTVRHGADLRQAIFSPDGRRLATASLDKTAGVWDAEKGKRLLVLRGHKGPVTAVAFSPDGSRLATGSLDQTTKVWDAHTGKELFTLPGHRGEVKHVGFSSDGTRLVSRDVRGTPLVWEVATGKRLEGAPPRVPGPPSSVAPDGRAILVDGGTAHLLRPAEEKEMPVSWGQTRLDPFWHADQAFRWGVAKEWFAATFHLERLLDSRDLDEQTANHAARAFGSPRKVTGEFLPPADLLPSCLRYSLRQLVAVQPELSAAWYRLILVHLNTGHIDDARKDCEQVQRRWLVPGELRRAALVLTPPALHPLDTVALASLARQPAATPDSPGDRLWAVRAAVLLPQPAGTPETWLALVPKDEPLLRGAVLCRAGRHAEAVQLLEPLPGPLARLFQTLAEHGRGDDAAARRALAEALRQWPPEKVDPSTTTPSWTERAEVEVLRREIEAMLKAK
jgi:WD40 repeat protein